MGAYSTTTANAYADKIKAVYEYLDEIRKVADRLTPVEDLAVFQAQIQAVYDQLDLLVEASNLIVTATPTGEAILTGSIASIKTLLDIGVIPDGVVWSDELIAALADLENGIRTDLGTTNSGLISTNIAVNQLDQYRISQQTLISGLTTDYSNIQAGLETNQSNLTTALQRLTVTEQNATLVDQNLTSINQSLTSTISGLQAANSTIAGHTASITTAENAISIQATSIDALSSSLVNTNTNVAANATALNVLQTTVQGVGDDLLAQSVQTTSLRSAIGGSGNLLFNADFSVGGNGWEITVAEEDWAATVLTINTLNMPEDVNCLEVVGAPTPLGEIVVESSPILVSANKHYIVSGYPCVDNGTVALSYKIFDSGGFVIGQGVCPPAFNATTSTNFNNYTRSWVKFLVSADAVRLRLYLTVTGDGDFVTQGALFRPMVEQAWSGQEGPSAWVPGAGAVGALATAVQSLETQVTQIEDTVTSQGSAITALENTVTTSNSTSVSETEPATAGRIENDLWIKISTGQIYSLTGGVWVLRPNNKNRVFAQPTPPTADAIGDFWIDTDDGNRPHRWNGTAWIDITDTRVTANASAISSLTTRVTAAEGVNTSQASAITNVTSRMTTAEGNITSQASATSTLSTQMTAVQGRATTLEARWGVTLDVNGYISGVTSVNSGTYASTTFVADSFKIVTPGQSPRTLFAVSSAGNTEIANDMYYGTGRIVVDSGTHMMVQGVGFGVGNEFVQWYGPKMAINLCSRAAADMYLTRTGDAYFGGSLSAGVLKNAVTSSTISGTAIVETGAFGTNGGPKIVVYSLSYNNFGFNTTDLGNGTISATISLQRSYNGGAWTAVGSVNLTGNRISEGFEPGSGYSHAFNLSGSATFTDNLAGTGNFNYRVLVTSPSGWPYTMNTQNAQSQRTSVISTES